MHKGRITEHIQGHTGRRTEATEERDGEGRMAPGVVIWGGATKEMVETIMINWTREAGSEFPPEWWYIIEDGTESRPKGHRE